MNNVKQNVTYVTFCLEKKKIAHKEDTLQAISGKEVKIGLYEYRCKYIAIQKYTLDFS